MKSSTGAASQIRSRSSSNMTVCSNPRGRSESTSRIVRKGTVQTERRKKHGSSTLQQMPSRSMRYVVLCLLSLTFLTTAGHAAEPNALTTAVTGKNLEEVESALFKENGGRYIPKTRFYYFNIRYARKTVNCFTKSLLTVNGQFPGPTIYAVEGDRIVVNVTNNARANMTIHWHGVKQRLSGWADGTGYITQCPLQPGDYFVYNFTVGGQRGTVFWHAHVNWARATVHGALIVYPNNFTYPFRKPANEFSVVIGEWWNEDVLQVEADGLQTGTLFAVADAFVINGKPGSKYNCTKSEGITTFKVSRHKTYLLRVINAAVNTEVFFKVAEHTLTVVEVDSEYVEPFETSSIFLAPGQTTNVLITTHHSGGNFSMAIKSFQSQIVTDYVDFPRPVINGAKIDFPMVPGSAIIAYPSDPNDASYFPKFPRANDTKTANKFFNSLKTLHPEKFPTTVDRNLFFTVGITSLNCLPTQSCRNTTNFRAAAAVNNITFILPTMSLLEASYFDIPGVFTPDFPDFPVNMFDYTYPVSPPLPDQLSETGTRLSEIKYGQTVQLVLQDTMVFEFENHPFHLHGYSFFVIGRGVGNYDAVKSPETFNLFNPPLRFTVDVPSRGWVVIRFRATNPGVWLFHCHFDKHVSWGMQLAFLVTNGVGPDETLPPPPRLMAC